MRDPEKNPRPDEADSSTSDGEQLLASMTGRASSAKAAEGDAPVFAYIASLPGPQRTIAAAVDSLAAKTPPDFGARSSGEWRITGSVTGGASAVELSSVRSR